MDSLPAKNFAIEANGWSAAAVSGLQIASLRYFDRTGSFAAAVSEALGQPLPEPRRVIDARHSAGDGRVMLAWRSPTETTLVCENSAAFADLERRLAGATGGCMVDMTGGISVTRLRGPQVRELLLRLGAQSAIPRVGEALSGRCAEVSALTACIQEGEYLCFVERVYAAHVLEWIRMTAADF
jgi:heterotetrameric sarcosine oxidase gamma subunit